jgi:DNA ligase-1
VRHWLFRRRTGRAAGEAGAVHPEAAEPSIVLEVLSAELTLSPNHTAGWGQLKDDAGLSMRFPRFTGRWRDDKDPQDATTTQQLVELYRTARRAPAE